MLASIQKALLAAGCLIVLLGGSRCENLEDKDWWETTLVYQIWPRGFQDSDGDGEGDLKGITNRLDYIKDLGVETILLSPIYPSPLIDSGYDISNYTDIHPLFGNFDSFDELLKEVHDRGLKLVLDIVPNHSSDQHEWFHLSTENVEPYKDYYIWSDGIKIDNDESVPPNNWVSTYSEEKGTAWTWHEKRQQWYYHKFHETQPDLNLRNERVVKEFMDIFDFWLRRGVDGFRISAVAYFFEDELMRNEALANGEHTFGLPENSGLLYAFRSFIRDWVDKNNSPSKLLIAESYDSANNLITYYGNGTHEGIPPFNFRFITQIHSGSNATHIKGILEEWFNLLPENTSTNWVLSNHDNSRAATRIGLNRVDGLHMLSLLLPGQAYTYYGEEIGMLDAKLLWNETIDPMGRSRGEDAFEQFSRDPARTPMQWDSSTSAGFSTNEVTYLPVHSEYKKRNVQDQQSQENSNIKIYQMLAALRKEPVFIHGDYEFSSLNNDHVLVLKRSLENHSVYIVVVNIRLRWETINLTSLYPKLKRELQAVVISTTAINFPSKVSQDNFTLSPNAAVVLMGEEEDEQDVTDGPTTEPTETTEDITSNPTIATETTEASTEEPETPTATEPEETTTPTKPTTTTTKPTTTTTAKPTTSTTSSTSTVSSTTAATETTTTVVPATTKGDDDDNGDDGASSIQSSIVLTMATFTVIVLFERF